MNIAKQMRKTILKIHFKRIREMNEEIRINNLIDEIEILNTKLLQYNNIEEIKKLYKTISENIVELNNLESKEVKLTNLINNNL
jgi:hypothetical protein